MSSHSTSKDRRKRQQIKRKYAMLREDCQLADIIATTPEGAVRNEVARVAPDPPLPHLVRAAIKDGWATPDSAKPKVVADLLAAFFEKDQDPMLRVRLARLLLLLDQTQWERDHPEEADKNESFLLNVNVVNVDSAPNKEDTGEQAAQLRDGPLRSQLTTINMETAG